MNTINEKIREQIIVWSTIVAVFAIITVFALSFDTIRESFNKTSDSNVVAPIQASTEISEPGYSVVLAQ